jgi:hypothetical protein
MRLDRLRNWHWIVIGLAFATTASILRGRLGQPLLSSYGEQINAQVDFETALLTQVGTGFQFHDLIVHTAPDPSANGQQVYIVRGMYWDGRSESRGPIFRPAYFVAHVPYAPLTDLSRLSPPGGPDYARQYQQLPAPTVMDFLRILSQARGVRYRHAWWITHDQAVWFTATFVSVGLIWPIVMNLLMYGRLMRPPQPSAPAITITYATVSSPAYEPTAASDAQLADVISELESTTQSHSAKPPVDAPAPIPVRALDAGPLVATEARAESADKAFGADADDYYPTERHLRKTDS